MIRIFCLGLIIGLSMLNVKAQSYKKLADLEAYRHHVSYADYQAAFYTLPLDTKGGRVKLDRDYYWFAGRAVNVTRGGYNGKLLHGSFTSFYLNKQLKEQGKFNKGLKEGEWKAWNEAGRLVLRQCYRGGLANGDFHRYDESGQLTEQGAYQGGKLNGKLKKYVAPDSVAVIRYRAGKIYQKQRFSIKKWMFWKKKIKE